MTKTTQVKKDFLQRLLNLDQNFVVIDSDELNGTFKMSITELFKLLER